MVLDGLEILEDTNEWESITSNHVQSYYDSLRQDIPDIFPILVTNVQTTLVTQELVPLPVSVAAQFRGDRPDELLLLKYFQSINYSVLFEIERPIDEKDLFLLPFEKDVQDYLIALIEAFMTEHLVFLLSLQVGETAPTQAPDMSTKMPTPEPTKMVLPPTNNEDNGLSSTGVAIVSVMVALLTIIIVAGVLFYKFKLDGNRRAQVTREEDTMEYDNRAISSGPAIEWRNPSQTRRQSTSSSGGGAPQDLPLTLLSTPEYIGHVTGIRNRDMTDLTDNSDQSNAEDDSEDDLGPGLLSFRTEM
jgi:hypothetical protein